MLQHSILLAGGGAYEGGAAGGAVPAEPPQSKPGQPMNLSKPQRQHREPPPTRERYSSSTAQGIGLCLKAFCSHLSHLPCVDASFRITVTAECKMFSCSSLSCDSGAGPWCFGWGDFFLLFVGPTCPHGAKPQCTCTRGCMGPPEGWSSAGTSTSTIPLPSPGAAPWRGTQAVL